MTDQENTDTGTGKHAAPKLSTIAQAIYDYLVAAGNGDMQETADIGEVIFDGVFDLEALASSIAESIGLGGKSSMALAVQFTPAAERVMRRAGDVLKPFVVFSKTLTSWHVGGTPVQEMHPHDTPVAQGSFPLTATMNQCVTLYADDFKAAAVVAREIEDALVGRRTTP